MTQREPVCSPHRTHKCVIAPPNFRRLADQISVVVVLVGEVGVFQKLIRRIEYRRAVLVRGGPIADGIVIERFERIGWLRIHCLRQPVQHVVRVVRRPNGVGLRFPVPDLVVRVGERVDGHPTSLMREVQ